MASGMKQYANNFKTQFEKDSKMMNNIEKSQEDNIQKTEKENERMAKLQSSAVWGFWTKIIILIAGVITFVCMMSFIWLFPDKVSHKKQIMS